MTVPGAGLAAKCRSRRRFRRVRGQSSSWVDGSFISPAVRCIGGRCRCAAGGGIAPRGVNDGGALKLSHKAIGVEVRRGTYTAVVDDEVAGSVDMNETIEVPLAAGRHTLKVRNGRNSSGTKAFDAKDGEIVAFRCTGKSIVPRFLLSFIVPNWAISVIREKACGPSTGSTSRNY